MKGQQQIAFTKLQFIGSASTTGGLSGLGHVGEMFNSIYNQIKIRDHMVRYAIAFDQFSSYIKRWNFRMNNVL